MLEAGAAFVAWLGMSVVVLADGRRGLALGIVLVTAGLAVIVFQGAGPIAAGALGVGGAAAALRRLTHGPSGWRVMPPGSTPRVVLCVAAGILVLWISFSATTAGDSALRFAILTVLGLSVARVLSSDEPSTLLTAIALLALGIAATVGIGSLSHGLGAVTQSEWPYIAAALVAAVAGWLPVRTANVA